MPNNNDNDTQQPGPQEGDVIVSDDPKTKGQRARFINGDWEIVSPSAQKQMEATDVQRAFFQRQAAIPGNTPQAALAQFYRLHPELVISNNPPDAEHMPPSFASEYLKNTDPALTAFNIRHPLASAENIAKGIYQDPGKFALNVLGRMGVQANTGAINPFTTIMTMPGMPFAVQTRPQPMHFQNWENFKKNIYDHHFGGAAGDFVSAAANITSQIEFARQVSPEAAKLTSPGQINKDMQDMVLEGGTRLQKSVLDRLRDFAVKNAKTVIGGETDAAFEARLQKLRETQRAKGLSPEAVNSEIARERSKREVAQIEAETKAATTEPSLDPQLTSNSRFQKFSEAKGSAINDKLIEDPAETRQLGKLITKITGDPSIEKDLRQWTSLAAASAKYSRNAMKIYGLRGTSLAVMGWFIGHGVGSWAGGALGGWGVAASETMVGRYGTYFRLKESPFTYTPEGGLEIPGQRPPGPPQTPPQTTTPGTSEAKPPGGGAGEIPPPETFLKPPWAWERPPDWMRTTMSNLQEILKRLKPEDQKIVREGFEQGKKDGAATAADTADVAEPTPREREQIRRRITDELNGPAARAALRALDANPAKWQDWMKRFNIRGGQ